MINKNELLSVVNERDIPIEPKPRFEVHEKGDWHRVSHDWVYNAHGQILCQQRSMQKDSDPGKWQPFFGGHLTANIGYLEGAVIEINEELGLNFSHNDLTFVLRHKDRQSKEFQGVFCVFWDGDPNDIQFEKAEVEKVSWIDIDELKKISENNPNWANARYENEMFLYLEKIVGDTANVNH